MTAGTAPALVRSMTGFARVRKQVSGGEVTVSVKSLNHRALDIHIHTGLDLGVENEIRTYVKRALSRGHVEIRIGYVKNKTDASVALNRGLFEAYLAALSEASGILGKSADVDLNAAMRIPGMVSLSGEFELNAADEQMILEALDEALRALNGFREREGSELKLAMLRHNARVLEHVTGIEAIRVKSTPLFQARLQERLGELLHSANVDPQRLAQEAAVLTDRSDISEETSRLRIHSNQLDAMLVSGGEIGKKIDFLLQEMNRETNTILSKTNGIGDLGLKITELGLNTKSDIEKIREQSLNIE
ncbi:MAG TPA: YicC/YloC family endoribonuclease [Bryobacteraceae bacterium]|jgi:uncharacterized protein (TIGR00255 family)